MGHIFKSLPTNSLRVTAAGLSWWSSIQVLTDVDVPITSVNVSAFA